MLWLIELVLRDSETQDEKVFRCQSDECEGTSDTKEAHGLGPKKSMKMVV